MKVALAGLVIEATAPDGLAAAVLPLFEACEDAPDGAAADLTIAARPQDARVARPDERSLFYASEWHAHATEGGWALFDGASRIGVDRDGARIDVALHPDSMGDMDAVRVVAVMAALLLALRRHGLYHLHGGCVRRADGVTVLVAGDSGHGKSTTTLALLEPGARIVGDDTLLLRATASGVEIHGVPRWFHVTENTWRAFDWLADAEVPDRRTVLGKRCIDPRRLSRGELVDHVPWSAPALLLLPRVDATQPTEWQPLDAADAFGALLVASAWVVVDDIPGREAHLELLGALTRVAVAVDGRMGPDALRDPAVLPAWIRRVLVDQP